MTTKPANNRVTHPLDVVIAGTGNVAWHMAYLLQHAGHTLKQVYGRRAAAARRFGREFQCSGTTRPEKIRPDADLVIIAVADTAISGLAAGIPVSEYLVVHTSGSEPLSSLKRFTRHGVLYPLQSLVRGRKVSPDDIPLCVEAGDTVTMRLLSGLARTLGGKVWKMDSEQRFTAHLAAVFAGNFSNYMYTAAGELLDRDRLPMELLWPLIRETADRLHAGKPHDAQTGPARRGDDQVIKRHLQALRDQPGSRRIYKLVSDEIMKRYSTREKTVSTRNGKL